jgi:hypothetical protein
VAVLTACSVKPVDTPRPHVTPSTAASSPVATPVSAPSVSPPAAIIVAQPTFRGTMSPVPAALADDMRGTTWRPGCPVPISGLRYLTLSYWDLDGNVRRGPMVVNSDYAGDIVWVFRQLFKAHFQIQRMTLSKRFDPKHDNPNSKKSFTGSFNCRVVVTPAGPGTTLSMHSYGLAVDINSLQNPFVREDGFTRNRYARPYVERSKQLPGMIHDGDVVVRAFEHIGWVWGGNWSGDKDYMHFSSNGR